MITQPVLGSGICAFLQGENKSSSQVQAMITPVHANVPFSPRVPGESGYDYRLKNYSQSLKLLSLINNEFPDMSLIAYTGAESCPEIEKLFRTEGKVKSIVYFSYPENWQENSVDLRLSLEACLGK